MITRLGVPPGGDTGSTILNKFNDLFYMSTNWGGDLQAQAYEDWQYGTIPNVTSIVATPGSPVSMQSSLTYSPLQSAVEGQDAAKAAQTAALTAAAGTTWFPAGDATIPNLPSLSGIPWGTIAIAGALVVGVILILGVKK